MYRSKEELERSLFLADLPGIIFLLIVCMVGTIGNLHVIVVYSIKYKPSNHRILIVVLSTVDFLACIVAIPLNVHHLRYYYSTPNFVCSLFLPHFVSFTSVFLLAAIAIERFRKVCQPLKRQLSSNEVGITCVILIIVSIILSIPAFQFYGSELHRIEGTNLTLPICAFPRANQNQAFLRVYNMTPPFFGSISIIICLVVYSIIGKLIYSKAKAKEFSLSSRGYKTDSITSMTTSTTTTSISKQNELEQKEQGVTLIFKKAKITLEDQKNEITQEPQENKDTPFLPLENNSKDKDQNGRLSGKLQENRTSTLPREKLKQATNSARQYNRTLQITLMLLVATGVSYICYLVSVTFLIFLSIGDLSIEAAEHLGPGYIILEHFFTISNAINPIVYALFDWNFRKRCCIMYTNIIPCLIKGQ